MALPRRRALDDESEPLQPVFHAMENISASFPRYGKLFSTVWKTYGQAAARTIPYSDLRAPNPAPGFMIMRAEQRGPGYGPQAVAMRSPSHATIVYRIARGPSPEP